MKRSNWLLLLGIMIALILLTGGLVNLQGHQSINTEGVEEISIQKAADTAKQVIIKPFWEATKKIIHVY